jgi:hypothetical protein
MRLQEIVEYCDVSKTYKAVLRHRNTCPKWGKSFCLKCFGGGLNNFTEDLIDEFQKVFKK